MRFLFFFLLCVCARGALSTRSIFRNRTKTDKKIISIALCFHIRTQRHFCSNVALFDVWTLS